MIEQGIDCVRYAVIGSAMAVHGELGSGFQEVVYQRAMEIELSLCGVGYEREKEMRILYKGEDIGSRRVDFYVESSVMVELKAVGELNRDHMAQAKNYMEAYGIKEGLLINFGGDRLEYKRLYPRKLEEIQSANILPHSPEILSHRGSDSVLYRGSDKGVNAA